MRVHQSDSSFAFVGNCKCVDFVNTELKKGGQPVDLLEDFAAFVRWLIEAQILSRPEAARLLDEWNNTPESEQAFEAARELRALLRKTIERIAAGKPIQPAAVKKINEHLRHQTSYTGIVKTDKGLVKRQYSALDHPIKLLAPIAQAATDLLCSPNYDLVRKCESDSCVLYFHDTTKNHTRRWCSMSSCGNRHKVANYYGRHAR